MKKLILIVLVVSMCISVVGIDVVLAKAEFGNWDKWDEELPPAEHKYWYWAIPNNESRVWDLKGFGNEDSDLVLLFSDLYFYGTKSGKTKASVIFYSSDMNVKKWDIPNASLAIAAFPPIKEKMIIRAYKMEDKIFKFFGQWEIPFKEHEVVVPEDEGMEFRQIFKEWLKKEISSERTIPEGMIEMMLPELVIWEKKFFMITDATKLNKK